MNYSPHKKNIMNRLIYANGDNYDNIKSGKSVKIHAEKHRTSNDKG